MVKRAFVKKYFFDIKIIFFKRNFKQALRSCLKLRLAIHGLALTVPPSVIDNSTPSTFDASLKHLQIMIIVIKFNILQYIALKCPYQSLFFPPLSLSFSLYIFYYIQEKKML